MSRLRAALEKINPALPPEAITAAIDVLPRDRSAMLLEQANREVYRLLKEGIPVSVAEKESTPHPGADSFAPAHSALGGPSPSANSSRRFPSASNLPGRGGEGARTSSGLRPPSPHRGEGKGGQTTVRVRVIDWEQPANNNFLLSSQFSVTGALGTCRPDLAGFINGLALVVIEMEKPSVPARRNRMANLPWGTNLSVLQHGQEVASLQLDPPSVLT